METFILFAYPGLYFWILIAAASLALLSFMENEKGLLATVTVVATVCLLHYFGGKHIFGYVAQHKLQILYFSLAYFGLGVFWGINKWWFFVRRERARYDHAYERFNVDRKSIEEHRRTKSEIPWNLAKTERLTWADCVKAGNYDDCAFIYKPNYKKHKGKLLMWMTYWPWSFLWTMMDDPVKKLFNAAIDAVRSVLDRISDRAFRDTEPHMQGDSNRQ